MSRIREIFVKIKQGHELWKSGDDAYKKRLEKAFEPFFDELEELGVDRHFTEGLLFFGRDFVVSFRKEKDDPVGPAEIENIFGVKAVGMNDKAKREAMLAKKSGALIWQSVPMKGDQVGIKILTYKKKQL